MVNSAVEEGRGRLSGKVAFITGASGGIGEVTARHLASHGAKTVLAARSVERGETIAAEIRTAGGDVLFVECDVTEPDSVSKAFDTAFAHHGRLDVLFNNAGGSTAKDGPLTDAPLDEFWRGRGYEKVDGLMTSFAWKDRGETQESKHPMQFWMRAL